MSKEQKSTEKMEKQSVQPEFKRIENMAAESAVAASDKRRNRTFMGMIAAAVVLIAALIGIGTYNIPTNRMSRHLKLGARYLEEQNYEQAVVEFDQVIAIDPMSVDAYLGKAQAYEGMGDMEKAIETLMAGYEKTGDAQLRAQLVDAYLEQAAGYVQAADYDSALAVYDKLLELDGENERVQEAVGDCLTDYIEQLISEERYDEAKTLIEKYRDKVSGVDFQAYLDEIEELKAEAEREELLANVPAFDLEDITIAGYDLLEPHFDEVLAALGYPYGDTSIGDAGIVYVGETEGKDGTDLVLFVPVTPETSLGTFGYDGSVLNLSKVNDEVPELHHLVGDWCELPIVLEDSYEKWCEKIGVDLIKKSRFAVETTENGTEERTNTAYTEQLYTVPSDEGEEPLISYFEKSYETIIRDKGIIADAYWYDYDMIASLTIGVENKSINSFSISAHFLDDTLQYVHYSIDYVD